MNDRERIKKELIERIDTLKTTLANRQAIKRIKTKDGNDFKTFSKNFQNVTFEKDKLGEVIMYIDSNDCLYVTDFYNDKNVDELFEYIEKGKENLKRQIEEYTQQLNDVDNMFNKVDTILKDLKNVLNDDKLKNSQYSYGYNKLGDLLSSYVQNKIRFRG